MVITIHVLKYVKLYIVHLIMFLVRAHNIKYKIMNTQLTLRFLRNIKLNESKMKNSEYY